VTSNLTYPSFDVNFNPVPAFGGLFYTNFVILQAQARAPCPGNPPILAHANSAPQGLVSLVPELADIHDRNWSPGLMRYGDPECPILKGAIGGFMRAPTANILVTGSTLQALERMPAATDCDAVVCAYGDFAGYAKACQLHHLPLHVVSAQPGRDDDLAEQLARAVRKAKRPLVPLTVGVTNPLMTQISTAQTIRRILEANPFSVIVLDTAYAAGHMDQAYYARLALNNPNVITLVPASKVLLHAGLAAGWMVVGDEALRAKLKSRALPYPMSGIATAMLPDLLQAEHVIARMREIMMEAGAILVEKLTAAGLGDRMIAGNAPWLLLDMGEDAGEMAARLAAERIFVQRQSGTGPSLPRNWLRLSFPTPHEAERMADSIVRKL
jgi:histidinol-phosphate/aromatic aminotransferase/cobyric acid decarboxylase-like protein